MNGAAARVVLAEHNFRGGSGTHKEKLPTTVTPLTLATPFVIHHPVSARKSGNL